MNVPTLRTPPWRWFLPRPLRGAVTSAVLMLNLLLVGLAMSMLLIGGARAGIVGSGTDRVHTYVGSFAKAVVTGNHDIALPAGCPNLTSAPAGSWAIVFSSTTYNTAGSPSTWSDHAQPSVGFTTGASNSYAVCAGMGHNLPDSNTARRMAAKCITIQDLSGGAFFDEADFVSFPDATHMRINWTSQSAGTGAIQINYMIVTGLTGAKAVNWTEPGTATIRPVTGVGFRPDLVLHAFDLVGGGALPQSTSHAALGFGAMNSSGEQWATSIQSQDNLPVSDASRWQRTDSCLLGVWATEAELARAAYTSMDADGFTTTWAAVNGGSQVISLCLDGVASKVGSFTSTASPQTVNHNLGKAIKGALFVSSTTALATTAAVIHARLAVGLADGTNERAAGFTDDDNLTTTVAKSAFYTGKSLLAPATAAAYDLGSVAFTNGNTMTVTWSVYGGGAGHLYLLIAEP